MTTHTHFTSVRRTRSGALHHASSRADHFPHIHFVALNALPLPRTRSLLAEYELCPNVLLLEVSCYYYFAKFQQALLNI
jgi:hypothetical protein